MSIPMADLKAQYLAIRDEIDAAVQRVINNSQFILGPEVEAFEKEMAAYCGTGYAVGVASGTEALQLALLACGIGPGDEVITTPFTFIATAEAITQCGAVPVFVDIDPVTYNIDTSLIENSITSKTRCILPVHLYGEPAAMDAVMGIAKKHDLKVIEDCAQALGAQYAGKKVGSLGDAGCLSFFPSKVLGAYGDGGMVVTSDQQVAEKLRMLRNHGARQKYYHLVPGFNSRLDGLQAAILRVKLKHLDKWIEQRREKAALYAKYLGKLAGVSVPHETSGSYHCYNYYTIRLTTPGVNREALQKGLSAKGVSSMVYYPILLHLQTVYSGLGYKKGDFPESEKAQDEVLSLPIYPEMTEDQVAQVAAAIGEVIN